MGDDDDDDALGSVIEGCAIEAGFVRRHDRLGGASQSTSIVGPLPIVFLQSGADRTLRVYTFQLEFCKLKTAAQYRLRGEPRTHAVILSVLSFC